MCVTSLLKTMMFIFNGLIFVAGIATSGVGIWVSLDSGSLMSILGNIQGAAAALDQLTNIGYLLVGVGVVLLIIGFLGCCGAMKESPCMLLTFFGIVLVLFIIEVAGAIVLLVSEDVTETLVDSLEDEVRSDIELKYGSDVQVTELWNVTMFQFKCCGFKNYTDFAGSPFVTTFLVYPFTCCNSTYVTDGVCSAAEAALSLIPGCFQRLVSFVKSNTGIVAGVALGIAALEIAAMFVSFILYKDIGRNA